MVGQGEWLEWQWVLPEMQTRPRQGERSAGGPLSEGLWADHSVLAWPLLPTAPPPAQGAPRSPARGTVRVIN